MNCRHCTQPLVFVTRENAKFFGHLFRPAEAIHLSQSTPERTTRTSLSVRHQQRLRVRLEKRCRKGTTMNTPLEVPPLIRELASPLTSHLHLKAPVEDPKGHTHDKPTLCGQEDHGSWSYTIPKTMADLERLRRDNGPDADYPLCPFCVVAFIFKLKGVTDAQSITPTS